MFHYPLFFLIFSLYFKGSVSQDFRPQFFSPWFEPIWALINSLQYFRIGFRFRRDIRSQSDLRGAQHTAEIISAVCNIPRRLSLRCASHRGNDLCTHHRDDFSGVQHTAEIISAVCNRLWRRSPWWATHCRDKLHTKETKSNSSLVVGCF